MSSNSALSWTQNGQIHEDQQEDKHSNTNAD